MSTTTARGFRVNLPWPPLFPTFAGPRGPTQACHTSPRGAHPGRRPRSLRLECGARRRIPGEVVPAEAGQRLILPTVLLQDHLTFSAAEDFPHHARCRTARDEGGPSERRQHGTTTVSWTYRVAVRRGSARSATPIRTVGISSVSGSSPTSRWKTCGHEEIRRSHGQGRCSTRRSDRTQLPTGDRWQTGKAAPAEARRRSGQGRSRTADTRIFSPLLYQLSYLARGREI